MFDLPTFPDAIRAIYQSTMDDDRGLRDILVDVTVRKVHDLVKDPKFNDTLVKVGAFGKDLVHVMNRKLEDSNIKDSKRKTLEDDEQATIACPTHWCIGQRRVKTSMLVSGEMRSCTQCGLESPRWRWTMVGN
ncbi:hypothetical protein BKA80DRAFT_115084 [Phyllosticta citrichinensis]